MSDTARMLDELAAMDMAAARHVHACLLEATDPAQVADLSRAYQRLSRSARQALMLKMRHEAEMAKRPAAPAPPEPDARDILTDARIEGLQDAVSRVAAVALRDRPRLRREALDRLDVLIDDWMNSDDEKLLLDRLDDLVEEACEHLGLPMALARTWEDLPEADGDFDPAGRSTIHADTG